MRCKEVRGIHLKRYDELHYHVLLSVGVQVSHNPRETLFLATGIKRLRRKICMVMQPSCRPSGEVLFFFASFFFVCALQIALKEFATQ